MTFDIDTVQGRDGWSMRSRKRSHAGPDCVVPIVRCGILAREFCRHGADAEIAAVFETDAIHVGMDEVFLIGEKNCPRCQGRDKAELFAQEVRTLHDFLATKKAKLWMWGDRFIDGRTTEGKSTLNTWKRLERRVSRTRRPVLVPRSRFGVSLIQCKGDSQIMTK